MTFRLTNATKKVGTKHYFILFINNDQVGPTIFYYGDIICTFLQECHALYYCEYLISTSIRAFYSILQS